MRNAAARRAVYVLLVQHRLPESPRWLLAQGRTADAHAALRRFAESAGVRVPEQLTHVPKAPAFVEGVINLRGAVLPVIDLRRRLGLESIARADSQRVVVFLIKGTRTGFIVDSVAEVLKVHKSAIEPAPKLSSEQATLLSRMANLEKQKRMIQLIDPNHLLKRGDLKALANMSEE